MDGIRFHNGAPVEAGATAGSTEMALVCDDRVFINWDRVIAAIEIGDPLIAAIARMLLAARAGSWEPL